MTPQINRMMQVKGLFFLEGNNMLGLELAEVGELLFRIPAIEAHGAQKRSGHFCRAFNFVLKTRIAIDFYLGSDFEFFLVSALDGSVRTDFLIGRGRMSVFMRELVNFFA